LRDLSYKKFWRQKSVGLRPMNKIFTEKIAGSDLVPILFGHSLDERIGAKTWLLFGSDSIFGLQKTGVWSRFFFHFVENKPFNRSHY
jgi:hypothetical protein